jgi:xanthosine utilization system XapX-like protein
MGSMLPILVVAGVLFAATWIVSGPPNTLATVGMLNIAVGVGAEWMRRRCMSRPLTLEERADRLERWATLHDLTEREGRHDERR